MAITNQRKHELRWEAVDAAFNLMEYWGDLRPDDDLTDEERRYMRRAISRMAKHVGVTNHFLIV